MSKDKSLLIIGPRSVGGEEGGIEKQIFLMLPYLTYKYKVYIVVDNRYKRKSLENIKKAGIKNVEIIGVKVPRSRAINKIYLSFIGILFGLYNKPDIVYFNGLGSCLFLGLMKILHRSKIVVHIRSYDVLYPDWNIFGKMVFTFILLQVRIFSDVIITVNEIFKRMFKRSNVYFVENIAVKDKVAASLEDFKKKYGLDLEKERYVLFVGRITPFKNIEVLIRAFLKSKLRMTHKLLIAGGISDKKYFKKLRKYSHSNIIFLGKVDRKYLPLLYKHADAFVLPSLYEGMPNVVMESCSYNIPTYVSRISPHFSIRFLKNDAFFKDEEELSHKFENPKKTCIPSKLKELSPDKISKRIIEIMEK